MSSRRFGAPQAERSAFLSALLPGLGQWFDGRRWRGLLLALPALTGIGILIVVLVAVSREGSVGVAKLLVQPRWLWALVALNAALALERLVAVGDAWLHRRAPAGGSVATWAWRAAVLLLVAVLLVPHVIVHWYATEALGTLETVFGGDSVPSLAEREEQLLAQDPDADLGPTLSSSTTTTPAPSTTIVGTSTSTVAPTSSTVAADSPLGDRLTVLLAGGDFGPGRQDLRTDVMIVASVDLVTGKAALISVYRDLVDVPLPPAWSRANTMIQVQQWHEDRAYAEDLAEARASGAELPPQPEMEPCDCYADRINYLYVHTHNWVHTFPDAPDPGMEALRQTLSRLLGIEIDYYVLVDFAGFVDLVDALGGVHVTVTESMDVAYSPAREGEEPVRITVEPGEYVLDGHQALAYVRDRTTGAQERMRRQHCMMRDVAAEINMTTLLLRFPVISEAIRTSTTTNIPLDYLPYIIEAVGSLQADDIATFSISSYPYVEGLNYMNLPIVDAPAVRAGVADLLAGVSAGTTLGTVEADCGG